MKQADQAAAASQSQVCQKIGLPTLLANLDAVSQEQTLLSVFDQLQAAKVSCSGTCMAIWDPLVNSSSAILLCCAADLHNDHHDGSMCTQPEGSGAAISG